MKKSEPIWTWKVSKNAQRSEKSVKIQSSASLKQVFVFRSARRRFWTQNSLQTRDILHQWFAGMFLDENLKTKLITRLIFGHKPVQSMVRILNHILLPLSAETYILWPCSERENASDANLAIGILSNTHRWYMLSDLLYVDSARWFLFVSEWPSGQLQPHAGQTDDHVS